MSIENYNFANDSRTQGPASAPVISFYGCLTCGTPDEKCECPDTGPDAFEGGTIEIELPSVFEVCPVCRGKGTHVDPSIDSGGISTQEFNEDPDFADEYFFGTYDVTCNRCDGLRVVAVPDFAHLDSDTLKAWENQQDAEREVRAEMLAERMAGC